MDTIPIENGQDTKNQGRVAWGTYDNRGNKTLIVGIYGPPRGDDNAYLKFFEEEVLSILNKTTCDKVIKVGD